MAAAARLDAGEPHLSRVELDLVALIERVVARFQPSARHGHLTLEYAVPDDAVRIVGDDILLERAVSNLVHNAIRHRSGADGGRVALVLEQLRTSGSRRPDRFRITVLDDGTGVDDDLVARLDRGEGPRGPERSRGRGLGLRIVRAVAAAHALSLAFARAPEGGIEVRLEGKGGENRYDDAWPGVPSGSSRSRPRSG
jgi:signal transduction histidine kinase